MKLVIAEKPSVAVNIAKVIGANKKENGYYIGNDYIVSWCVGHLIQMENPESYDEKYKKWEIKNLPIIPKEYKYKVNKNTNKQYQILKKLLHDKRIDKVINACDAGREGELIFRLVYSHAKSNKKIKRLWISSMEDSAIKKGIENLKDGKNYEKLYESALSRQIADWLVGMNLSRLYSSLYNKTYSVGRVQTPTLYLIAKRDFEIENFKKEKYYTVEIDTGEIKLHTERINKIEKAQEILESVEEKIKIDEVIKKEKITKPDLPYDLTTLQREANKYYGYSANETLNIAQSLYEKKLITYPRTDSRYLTEDMITNTINNIIGKNEFDTERIKIIFDNKKVTDHHAIIPTIKSQQKKKDIEDLLDQERKIYKLIENKLHASFSYTLKENTTKIIVRIGEITFTTNGKQVVDEGYTKYLKEYINTQKEEILPNINKDKKLIVRKKEIKEKYTTPPKHYTEDTLLKTMENATEETNEDVERKGLGTPATRAGIIENLIQKELIKREKKNLIITEKGNNLVSIVYEKFRDPKTTSEWELKLNKISKGEISSESFLKEIENEITEVITRYKNLK